MSFFRTYLSLFLFLSLLFLLVKVPYALSQEVSSVSSSVPTSTDQQYQLKKEETQKQIEAIDQEIDKLTEDYEGSDTSTTQLSLAVSERKQKIQEIDKLTFDTRLVIQEVDKQINDNQKKIDKLNSDLKKLNLEIQKREVTNPLKILFSSKNLGKALVEIYSLSGTVDQITQKKEEIKKVSAELETNKKQNEEIKSQLEKAKDLLRSEESNLEFLLTATQGKQSKFESLLNSITTQKKQLEANLGGLSGEYLAELEDLRNDESQKNNTGVSCSFEAVGLDIPQGYFIKPSGGVITQEFHCGHDGIDIASKKDTELVSIANGEVVRVGPSVNNCVGLGCNGGYGNYIVIKHTLPSGQRVYSLYAHMDKPSNKLLGQFVSQGETVGLMGCTGYTKPYPCGVHLHFMLISETYEQSGLGCRLGKSTCYNPLKYINF